jgi:hypothetical protein
MVRTICPQGRATEFTDRLLERRCYYLYKQAAYESSAECISYCLSAGRKTKEVQREADN